MCLVGPVGLGLGHVLRGSMAMGFQDPMIEGYTNFLGQGLSFVDFNLDGWDD